MASRQRTAFEQYVTTRRKNAGFERAYLAAREEVAVVDEFVRALDRARVNLGMSKAELARRIGTKPEVVRRLLTVERANPTLRTLVVLAGALGLRLELIPNAKPKRAA